VIPAWVGNYVGLPFIEKGRDRSGVDCWGLLRRIYSERYCIELPSYADDYQSTADSESIRALILGGLGPWREIQAGQEHEGDGILLRIKGQPWHVGVVVAPGWMLHSAKGMNSVRDQYDGPAWHRRVLGFYRHEAMA